jgi:hypothetical protein
MKFMLTKLAMIPKVAFFLFLVCHWPYVMAYETETNNEKPTKHDIKQGERYFKGLLPKGSNAPSCVSCHYYRPADTINWNPAAIEIAQLYYHKSVDELTGVLLNPFGKLISEAHGQIDIPEDQVVYLKAYLDNLAVEGLPKEKPSAIRLVVFLLLGLIITWALLDLLVLRKVKVKVIPLLIFLGAFGYQLFMLYEEAVKLGRSEGYMPDQPIKFSHQIHAGDNKIDCMYCHYTAPESKSANIPSTSLCMNCHIVVREGTHSGRFEIDKLVKAHEEGRSIEWIRVHQLPDHAFFSHAQHVGVGKLDCAQCHGQVEEMHIIQQVHDLSMGWCLECHRQTKVQFEENEYYSLFEAFHKDLQKGVRDSIMAVDVGANECSKCHY